MKTQSKQTKRVIADGVIVTAIIIAGKALVTLAAPSTITPYIKYDQFGYLSDMRKIATIIDPQVGFNAAESFTPGVGLNQYELRRWSDNAVVYQGTLSPWSNGATHQQSGDRGWHFDFSSTKTQGSYYIFDKLNNVGSGRLEINNSVYNDVLKQAVRVFYYQRLNTPKVAPYTDAKWTEAAAYERPGQDRSATSQKTKGNVASARDLSGGWMDAGDTNKYTTFAESAVLQLLDAYRANPTVFGDNFNIPESGNGVSDLLDEIKWELEFLKKMQTATGTGGLFLKLGVDNYNSFTPPSADTSPRYYLPECTSASIAGSAMFASAWQVYNVIPSQTSFANDLLIRAESAWQRFRTTTANYTKFEENCDTGDIKSGDADVGSRGQVQSALIAAVYLYEATSKTEYRSFIESKYKTIEPISNSWWGPYNQPLQAALLRFSGMSGVSSTVVSTIRTQKAGQNSVMSINDYRAMTDLYNSFLPDPQYHWGHTMVRANVGNINHDFARFAINTADNKTYTELAAQHLHWLHGNNPLGLVYLSNMYAFGAERSVNEIYHTWFMDGTIWDSVLTSPNGPAPGYLVGGPNKAYTGSLTNVQNQPPQKAYREWNSGGPPENSWELTEPAIYSQAAYVQLLARTMLPSATAPDTQAPTAPTNLRTTNTPTATSVALSWVASTDNVGVVAYDIYNGNNLVVSGLTGTSTTIANLICNTLYSFTVRARDAAGNGSVASARLDVTTATCPPSLVTTLYDDVVNKGWENWSWSCQLNFAMTTPVKVGKRSIRANFTAWGGLSLRHGTGIITTSKTVLSFWAYAPVSTMLNIYIQTQDDSPAMGNIKIKLATKQWTAVTVTQASLGNPSVIKRVNLQLNEAQAKTVYFDQILITT